VTRTRTTSGISHACTAPTSAGSTPRSSRSTASWRNRIVRPDDVGSAPVPTPERVEVTSVGGAKHDQEGSAREAIGGGGRSRGCVWLRRASRRSLELQGLSRRTDAAAGGDAEGSDARRVPTLGSDGQRGRQRHLLQRVLPYRHLCPEAGSAVHSG